MHNNTPRMSDIGPYKACNLCIDSLGNICLIEKSFNNNSFDIKITDNIYTSSNQINSEIRRHIV